jgi:chemotaxis receptor (MCP) glutamine deamidase CheD
MLDRPLDRCDLHVPEHALRAVVTALMRIGVSRANLERALVGGELRFSREDDLEFLYVGAQVLALSPRRAATLRRLLRLAGQVGRAAPVSQP